MLVLSRNVNESIIIGEDQTIDIKILGVRGNQVKLGISAPPQVSVHREEIYHKVMSEREAEQG